MIYDEAVTGGVRGSGCALFNCYLPFAGQYRIGEVLFDASKARRGVLEKIVIKGVRVSMSRRRGSLKVVLYQDTFNGLWNEFDLVPFEGAVELIQAHLDSIENDLSRLSPC
jgi:hypothetical protein